MEEYVSKVAWDALFKQALEAERKAENAEREAEYWREVAEHDTTVAAGIRIRNQDLQERNRVLELQMLETLENGQVNKQAAQRAS